MATVSFISCKLLPALSSRGSSITRGRSRSRPLCCATAIGRRNALPLRGVSFRAGRVSRGGRAMAMSGGGAGAGPQGQKTEEEWRTILSPEQFRILRQKGTEWAGTGKYDKFDAEGLYECAGCGTPLYKSTTKFNSGCGWPAFFEGLPGAIKETVDADGRRIEITCSACGGHLGHVFKGEGFPTPTNERHCVNSISLKFTPEKN